MQPVDTPRIFSNRYELTHLIARGGMAQVYRARDRLLDRPVALKVLFPELSVDRAFVERFRREAQAAANLSHPNIVPVYDWGEDSGTYFIVMEFVAGQPLSALLRTNGPIEPHRAAEIGAEVANALSFAHKHGVVHRDVKPGNVLITDDGQVKVTDFGIARAVNTEESLTQTGAVMGTAAYFSPEQAEGIGVDSRSDIYSLGVVLFEMVAGRTPFVGDTPVAVASKHVRDQPPLPHEFNPAVPAALESVVMKSMAKSPDQRYANADEFRADLLRFINGQPVTAEDAAATRAGTAVVAAAGATALVGATTTAGTAVAAPVSAAAVPVLPATGIPGHARLGVHSALDDRRRARNRRLLVVILVGLAVLVAVVLLLLHALGYLGNATKPTFALPNVVGKQQAIATQQLSDDGLKVSVHKRTDPAVSGTVLSSDPTAQSAVSKGQTIALEVSRGPAPTVTVPSVVGQTLNVAEANLNGQGLGYRIKLSTSSQTNGTVLAQKPLAGSSVNPGSNVTLTVSSQTSVQVPMLVGQSQTAAQQQLATKGLQVGTVTSQCSTTNVAANDVSATTPNAGTVVTPNTPVNLVISTGPCMVTVQDVVGLSSSQAASTISGQGLVTDQTNTATCGSTANGDVISQNPTAGNQVKQGSTVTITVCQLPTTTNTITVQKVPNQTDPHGTAITPIDVTATDSSATATLTYADGGTLPPGLSIDAASGEISGTPTKAGVSTVTITVTDGSGASQSTSFTWTVT